MTIFLVVLLVLAIIVLSFCYSIYVSLIQKKNKAWEAISGVDVQLKKRYDLIPNILRIAAKFMEHEKSLLEEVTRLRSQAVSMNDLNSKLALDNEIKSKMAQVLVAIENYPQLKSDSTMMAAIQTYNEVEEHISAARRFHNSAVLELNNAVEIFPSSVFANWMGIKKEEFFKAEEIERKPVDASQYLK